MEHTDDDASHAGNGEEQEEEIIALKEPLMLWMVMILVQMPQWSVHNELVREPRHELHTEEGCKKGYGVGQPHVR